MTKKVTVTQSEIAAFCESPALMTSCSSEQLFLLCTEQLEKIQLAALQKRFAELVPQLAPLKDLADENKITGLKHIHDIVPLLFPHTVYKSYPMSLIDNCRFTQLNDWLNDYTTHDLSALDVAHCESLDEWLEVVEAQTPLRVMTSSGTSGKISLLPRSTDEEKHIPAVFASHYRKFNDEPGLDDIFAPHVYHVFPFARHGRHITSLVIRMMIEKGFDGDESHVLTLDGSMPTSILWMTGRLKKAQADGSVQQLKKTKAWKRLQSDVEAYSKKQTESYDDFYKDMLIRLKDKTAVMSLGLNYFLTMIDSANKHQLKLQFAPDSFLTAAGGLKGVSLTDEQIDDVKEAIPHELNDVYACSEFMALSRMCAHGHYHTQPWQVGFVLDPETGVPYPRKGIQTGRYAAFDLLATTYWAGLITGDEVTMNWDGGCDCGRNGPYLHGKVMRYSDKHGGDDKITCQRTAAAVDEMMEQINS